MIAAGLLVTVFNNGPAHADGVPEFKVDPFWPKPLPENWMLGQVSGIAVDKDDRIWVVRRPGTLMPCVPAGLPGRLRALPDAARWAAC